MVSLKNILAQEKAAARQRRIIEELLEIVRDIERSERCIFDLQKELADVNARYQGTRNTRQDVEYLTALLSCAKQKLNWEKQITSLQKRTPALLERLGSALNDPMAPPAPEIREEMLLALQRVKSAMERLQAIVP